MRRQVKVASQAEISQKKKKNQETFFVEIFNKKYVRMVEEENSRSDIVSRVMVEDKSELLFHTLEHFEISSWKWRIIRLRTDSLTLCNDGASMERDNCASDR